MKLDNYLKAAQDLQARAYTLTAAVRCEITLYHFTKKDGEAQKVNRPTVILEIEEAGEDTGAETFYNRYFAFYPFRTKEENDAVLARAAAKLERIAQEQKKGREEARAARALQPEAVTVETTI